MKSYVKKYGLWISLFFIIMAVTVLIMALNKVPSLEIKYAVFLMAFLFSVVVVIEFLKYQKDVRYLKALEGEISISLENLPKPKDDMEQGYQRLLLSLMEEKVRIQNVQEARTRDFTEYLTMWIHQVKTPISALHLLFGEKEQFIDLSEEQEELFLMEQYVEMALQYIRLDSETTDFVIAPTALDPVIREAVRKYARIFIRKKIQLEYKGTQEKVITDGKWLGFIIEQILSNALKYTPKGSIKIEVLENRITIEDTGIGIEAEDLPRIFEKGYTGFNGHAHRHSSGIGLYMCQKIAKKLAIVLNIESEIAKGTKVTLDFAFTK